MPKRPEDHYYQGQDNEAWRDRRAEMDKEFSRGLLIINGGGAVSLLAFLQATAEHDKFSSLTVYVLFGLLSFAVGLLFAVLHTHFRRRCTEISFGFSGGMETWMQTPCLLALGTMILSALLFLAGILVVFTGGMVHLVL